MLKNKYPDGILLKVIDKTDVVYKYEKVKGNIILNENLIENKLKPDSKEEFLNKLPK